jgi:NAD(P)H dehydrogenase (quinone)
MNVLLILAHPNQGSFNHAIAEAAIQALQQNGHQAVFYDLYQEFFDPILRFKEIPKEAALDPIIQKHYQEIALTEGIIIVHPNWWGMPPAIFIGCINKYRPYQ